MLSNRELYLIDADLEPDLTLQHEGAVGVKTNGIGDHYRWWTGLTPEQRERYRQNEREAHWGGEGAESEDEIHTEQGF